MRLTTEESATQQPATTKPTAKRRVVWLAVVIVALALVAAFVVMALPGGGEESTATVSWHPQQESLGRTGQVEGASATLVRRSEGISFEISTTSLIPGNAYTLWLVVIDNPAVCEAGPCAGGEIIGNQETDSQVLGADGLVADESGRGTLSGSVQGGRLAGWLPDRSFDNPMTAQVQLVINDHGPALDEFMPGMIETYRGGCSDDSPFPEIFPATALGDGEVGPNTCLLYQAAVFLSPQE